MGELANACPQRNKLISSNLQGGVGFGSSYALMLYANREKAPLKKCNLLSYHDWTYVGRSPHDSFFHVEYSVLLET